MSLLKGFKQIERETGRAPSIGWVQYLNRMIEVDEELKAVCLRLDSEGNEYCELSVVEAELMAGKLLQVAKKIKEDGKK
jgi:hypothetical protein